MRLQSPSKISRRLQERFFFKPLRDASPKSAMVRKPYPPGMHGKRGSRGPSDFGMALREKQKVRYFYGITDRSLRKYVEAAGRAAGKMKTLALTELLERRLDNAVFRLGFAPTRRIGRNVVSHGHILLNGRRAKTPSIQVRPGDVISVREASRGRGSFAGLEVKLKKHEPPQWLALDPETFAGTVKRVPSSDDEMIPFNLDKIIEFYSR